ncbi:hypothetical protein EIO60_03363|nr:hypothetical protein [Candidatus Pantoea persica]
MARRDSSGLVPDAERYANLAIVQVYAAPTYGWKGAVAVHPWIIFKRVGETRYNCYLPDGYWYGARLRLLVEHRGAAAEAMIPRIEAAIQSYP